MLIYSAFPVYLISAHIERLPGGSGKGALRCRADWTSSHWPPVWRTHRSTYCTVRWPSASASTSSPMDLALVSAASSPSLSLSFSLCVIYSDMAVTFQYSACFTYEDRGLKAKDRGDIFYNKQNEYVFRTLKWSLRSWLKSPRMIHMKGIMNSKHIR